MTLSLTLTERSLLLVFLFKEEEIPKELTYYTFQFLYDVLEPKFRVGDNYAYIINHNKEAYACGNNSMGHLLCFNNHFQSNEQMLPIMQNVKDVYFTYKYTYILTEDGKLNKCSFLDKTILSENILNIFPGNESSLVIKDNGNYIYDNGTCHIKIDDIQNIKKFYSIHLNKCLIFANKEVYLIKFTNNTTYKKILDNVKDIFFFKEYGSIITTLDGKTYEYFYNDVLKELDSYDIKDAFCSFNDFIYLTSKDEVKDFKNDDVIFKNVRKIHCTDYITIALTYSNEVYYWGNEEKIPTKLEINNIKDMFGCINNIIFITYYNEIYNWKSNNLIKLEI